MSRLFLQLSPKIFASAILASGLSVSENKKPIAQQPVIKSPPPPEPQSDSTRPHSVTLLSFGKDGTINFNKTGLNSILERVKDLPVVVYSINGATRTGKSYLLNHVIRFLNHEVNPSLPHPKDSEDWYTADSNQLKLFSWNAGSEPQTKGIQIWSEPFVVTRGDKKFAVLLLDCQGLFDKATTQQENAIIISISLLLSSVSMYNIMKNIDENILDYIAFASEFSTSLYPGNCDPHQQLMFVIRDFDFVEEFSYGYHDKYDRLGRSKVKNYYKEFFSPKYANELSRTVLLKGYDNISFYVMPDPGKYFRHNPFTYPPDADFQHFVKHFIYIINSDKFTKPKTFQDYEMTGKNLQKQVESFSTLFTHCKNLPTVESYLDLMVQYQNEQKLIEIMEWVESSGEAWKKENVDGVSDKKMTEFLVTSKSQACEKFHKKSTMGGKEAVSKYLVELEKRYQEFSQKLETQNIETREAVYHRQIDEYKRMYLYKQASVLGVGVLSAVFLSPLALLPTTVVNGVIHYVSTKPKPHWKD